MKGKEKLRILLFSFFLFFQCTATAICSNLEVHFIDVGQGDSIFIITPKQKTILIDAGIHSAENDKRNPFNYIKGLKKEGKINTLNIDAVFITHPHDDHYGGFNYLCRSQAGQDFKIENIYYSVFDSKSYGKFWSCMEAMIRESNFSSQISARGPPVVPDKEIDLKILYPFKKVIKSSPDKNDDSIVLSLQHQNIRFLFTGDASKSVERELLAQDIRSNVLKLGHHGSRTSSNEDFLKAVKPLSGDFHVVISSNDKDGKGKRYGHPHKETLATLERFENLQLYRTDLHGTVLVVSDGSSISISTLGKKEVSRAALWEPGKKTK